MEGRQNTTDACLRLEVTVVFLNLHAKLKVEKEEGMKAPLLTLCLHVHPWTIGLSIGYLATDHKLHCTSSACTCLNIKCRGLLYMQYLRNWLNNTKLSQQVGTFTVQHNASNIIYHLYCTNVKDKDNRSPLHLACESRNKGVV